ncbi:MFS transporter [Pseudoalteromonas sp. T1lg65]|uniref:MFS transporter n=1 Tax=Pseudoalteromonas sp. T1lg65 TaxID=2077101 RepID=UPI003F7A881B
MTRQRLATWFLLLASTMTVLASATLAPALPAMTKAFAQIDNAEFWSKMTLSLPGLVIALCAPLAGGLVDKFNCQKLLLTALALFTLSGGLGYLWQESLWLILFSRALMGVAVAFIMVSGTTLAGRYFAGPEFAKFMGLQAAFGGFGGVLFLSLAGFLAEGHWTWVFAIFSLALLVIPGVFLWVRDPVQQNPSMQQQTIPVTLFSRALLLCCVLALVEIVVLYGLTIHLPFYLSSYGASASSIGLIIAAFLLSMSCVSLLYGRVRRLLNVQQTHLLGWVIVAIGFTALGLIPTLLGVVMTVVVIGAGLGLVRPNLVVWLFEFVPPPLRGKAMGMMTTCYFLGQFLSPILFEPAVAWFGMKSFFLVLAGAIFLCILTASFSMLILSSKQPKREQC